MNFWAAQCATESRSTLIRLNPATSPDAIADAKQIVEAGYEAFKFDPMMRFHTGRKRRLS